MPEFKGWPKIPRLHKDIIVTEKIDGTNGCIVIHRFPKGENVHGHDILPLGECFMEDESVLAMYAQSRKRLLTRETDNYGFAKWVQENAAALFTLGEGYHYGEWWGGGIQRGYGLDKDDKRFSLFVPGKYTEQIEGGTLPSNVAEVPIIGQHGEFNSVRVEEMFRDLMETGSKAAPGYMDPEGIMIYHTAAKQLFKWPNDPNPKGEA